VQQSERILALFLGIHHDVDFQRVLSVVEADPCPVMATPPRQTATGRSGIHAVAVAAVCSLVCSALP